MTDSQKLDLMLVNVNNLANIVAGIVPRLDNLERPVADMIPKVNKIDAIESGITEIKLTLENEIRTNIVRVAEGHLDLYRKFDDAAKIENEKEIIAIRVNILETELRRIKNRLDQIA